MKRLCAAAFLLGCLGLPLFADADGGEGTKITFRKQFELRIPPDTMHATLSIDTRESDQGRIKKFFDGLLQKAKIGQKACKGGQYSISPRYDYRQTPSQFIDYLGSIRFECKFTDTDAFDTSLSLIKREIDPSRHKLTQGQIRWVSSTSHIQNAEETLRTEAIAYGRAQTRPLGEQMERACMLSRLDLERGGGRPIPFMRAETAMAADAPTQAPITEGQSITLSAHYTYHCR